MLWKGPDKSLDNISPFKMNQDIQKNTLIPDVSKQKLQFLFFHEEETLLMFLF